MSGPDAVRFGVIGCGYWGPNHIRNLSSLHASGAVVSKAADFSAERRGRVADLFPHVEVVDDAVHVIDDPAIDAVVIATPVASHYPLAMAALEAGKDVFVEKPFVRSVAEAEAILDLARRRSAIVMVGHTFEYSAPVNHIREVVESGDLGEIMYIRSLRVNLGLFQKDVNVLWDLAPHDISILRYVLGRTPVAVSALGSPHVSPDVADVASMSLDFGDGLISNVIVSWLDPRKVREMTIVGSRKMLVFDDVSSAEKIRIYDRGVDGPSDYDSFGEFQYSYRYGDVTMPYIREWEPLKAVAQEFLECIQTRRQPRSDGLAGLDVVRVLETADRSLEAGGAMIKIDRPRFSPVREELAG